MCRNTRRPLLCPNCVNRGYLNDLALRTARRHKQKLLESINYALEVQVCYACTTSFSHVSQMQQLGAGKMLFFPSRAALVHSTTAVIYLEVPVAPHQVRHAAAALHVVQSRSLYCRERRSCRLLSSSSMQSVWSLSGRYQSALLRQSRSYARVSICRCACLYDVRQSASTLDQRWEFLETHSPETLHLMDRCLV